MIIQAVLQELARHIHVLSVGAGTGVFFVLWLKDARSSRGADLADLLVRSFAASALPSAVFLLGCAFDPSLLTLIDGLNIYIAAAGLALLFVSWNTLALDRA